jgi:hypothetical protein
VSRLHDLCQNDVIVLVDRRLVGCQHTKARHFRIVLVSRPVRQVMNFQGRWGRSADRIRRKEEYAVERAIQELRIWLARQRIPLDGIEIELLVPDSQVENQIESAILASHSPEGILVRDAKHADRTVILGVPVTIRIGASHHNDRDDH